MFILAVVWVQQHGTLIVPLILVIAGVLLIVLFRVSFNYAVQNVEVTTIRVNEIKPNDGWLVAYAVAYLIPLASIALDEFNVVITGILAVVLIIILPLINSAIPHPLLFVRKYHFYIIKAENGIADYILVSKKKALRNAKHIKSVKRVFEYLLIDA